MLLKQAGADTVAFGLESSNKKTQKDIKKDVEPEKLTQAIELCQNNGIDIELLFLFGLPRDSIANSFETVKFFVKKK